MMTGNKINPTKSLLYKIALAFGAGLLLVLIWILTHNIALFSPVGFTALRQRNLIVTLVLTMLVIVVPTLALAVIIPRKYRYDKNENYDPDSSASLSTQILWWLAPALIIAVTASLTWKSSHALDPYKPIPSMQQPLKVQVIALQWKWLFLYPTENVATINYLEIPEKTPIEFELTAEGLMNSFWIPKLGGQIYAMAGMKTKLNLMANEQGEFPGMAAEINGKGFSGMRFVTKSVSSDDFETWASGIRDSDKPLTTAEYDNLVKPSENSPASFYNFADHGLFDKVLNKYAGPQMQGMEM